MNKKKIIIICLSLVLLISVSTGVTIAYLGTLDKGKTNTLTIDKGDAAVSEVFSSPEYQLPQNTVQKEVAVENKGSEPCYVRVYLDFSDNLAKEKAMLSLSSNPNETDAYKSFADFAANIETLSNGKWKYVSGGNNALDGYFYYTEKVSGGQKTQPLIRYVKTDFTAGENAGLEAADIVSDFDIIVYSETVQTVFDGNEASNWQDAWQKFLRVT